MALFSRLYQKVLISIDLSSVFCHMKITYHNGKSEEKSYRTVNGDLPIEAAKYIREIEKKYPYTYIATMSKSQNQGLVCSNKIDAFGNFGLDISKLLVMLVNKKWFIYMSKEDIQKEKAKFAKVKGVDFIFSPFVLVYEKIKNRLSENKKLYILQSRSHCTLLIADKNEIYFGNYIVFDDEQFILDSNTQESAQEAIEFEAIGDIDENIIIKDFEDSNKSKITNLNELAIANSMIEIIKDTLNNFYKDARYASDFIEELIVLDAYGISDDSLTHLIHNTMLETQFIRINICDEIEKLAKMELHL